MFNSYYEGSRLSKMDLPGSEWEGQIFPGRERIYCEFYWERKAHNRLKWQKLPTLSGLLWGQDTYQKKEWKKDSVRWDMIEVNSLYIWKV